MNIIDDCRGEGRVRVRIVLAVYTWNNFSRVVKEW